GLVRSFARRIQRRPDAGKPALGAGWRLPRHARRRPARDRASPDRRAAAADHLLAGTDPGIHHVRRHLLRRHVWRIDHLDPAQHPGRVGLDHHRARRQPHGQARTRCFRPRDRRRRLLRRRDGRDDRPYLSRPNHGRCRAQLRPRRISRPDRARLYRDHRAARLFARPGTGEPFLRARDRPHRHRCPYRSATIHLRERPSLHWRRCGHRRSRPLRRRRNALGGVPDAPRQARCAPDQGIALDEPGRVEAVLEAMAPRHCARVPDWLAAGRRRRDPDLSLLRAREAALEAPRGVRPRRDRRGCRAGSGQQCLRRRRARSPFDAGAADLGDRGDHARRVPALRNPARPAALRPEPRPRLGPDRQPLHRQPDAAGAEPAACGALGPAPFDSSPPALRWHPRLRRARYLGAKSIRDRTDRALRDRDRG
ncbi:MAG: Tripartite tricarboxylate transporter TctA family, partial [uncultured Thermomicrobiales bacterium]